MARVIVFDVNETLLDLGVLDGHFQRLFGDASVRKEWFDQVLQSALVATITGVYTDFGRIGRAALRMTAERLGKAIAERDVETISSALRELPAYPDVRPALDRLSGAGLRLAALTNSAGDEVEERLKQADLYGFFEQVLSVDAVRRFKPDPSAYRMAAEKLGVGVGDLRLVAAHSWDMAGALRAGCAAAFVARPGQVLDPLVEEPDVIGRDLHEVAEKILAVEAPP